MSIRLIAADGRLVHFLFHLDIHSYRAVADRGVTLPMLRQGISNGLAIFGGTPSKLAIEAFENQFNSDVLGGLVEMVPTREMKFGRDAFAVHEDNSTVDNVLIIAANQVLAAHGIDFTGLVNPGFTGHVTGLLSTLETTSDIGYGPFPAGAHPTASASITGGVTSSLSTVNSEDPMRDHNTLVQNTANNTLPTLQVPTWAKVTAIVVAAIGGLLVTAGVLGYAARGVAQLERES